MAERESERERHDREIAEENRKRQIRLGHIPRPEAESTKTTTKESTTTTSEPEEQTTAKSTSKKSSAKK